MVPPLSQNTVGVCNQITFLILYFIRSKLVTLLKVTDAPIQVPNIFDLLVSCSLILAFRHSFYLFLKCLLTSHLTMFRLSTLLWLRSCTHCILAHFLYLKNLTFFIKNSDMLLNLKKKCSAESTGLHSGATAIV